jgi:hypothetical protein
VKGKHHLLFAVILADYWIWHESQAARRANEVIPACSSIWWTFTLILSIIDGQKQEHSSSDNFETASVVGKIITNM